MDLNDFSAFLLHEGYVDPHQTLNTNVCVLVLLLLVNGQQCVKARQTSEWIQKSNYFEANGCRNPKENRQTP